MTQRLDTWLVPSPPPSGNRPKSSLFSDDGASPSTKENRAAAPSKSVKVGPIKRGRKTVQDSPQANDVPVQKKAKRVSTAKATPSSDAAAPGGALANLKVVVTGVFNNRTREELEAEVKRRRGLLMSAVSSRTDVLVHGWQLEDGRNYTEGSKYKKAADLSASGKAPKLRVMDESAFEAEFLGGSVVPMHDDVEPATLHPTDSPGVQRPWAEKWRPQISSELIGNAEVVKKLSAWLCNWEAACLRGKPRAVPTTSRYAEPDRLNARCAFLSGPPGIGKTTAAHVACREAGFEAIEFNCSDDRGKNIIEVIGDMTSGGAALTSFFGKSEDKKKQVLVMDEMDGLSAGDRGGAQALLKLIEKSRVPVICIANDRMNTKIRTLVSKSYDLRFHKPPKNLIAKRLVQICSVEGLAVELNAAESLAESVGNDLRQCLNTLQLLATTSNCVSWDRMQTVTKRGLKDEKLMSNAFEMGRKLLTSSECRGMTLNDRLDAYFVDSGLMPLMMQENYLTAIKAKTINEKEKLKAAANAADGYSLGDIANAAVYRGNWGLVTTVALFTVIAPSVETASFLVRPNFPAWLGKNSSTNKSRRLLAELALFLSVATSNAELRAFLLDGFINLLYERLVAPLLLTTEDSKKRVTQSIELLDHYGITRNHLLEHIIGLRLKRQDRTYESVDSKIKAALTTTYNNTSHTIKMAPTRISVKRGAGSGVAETTGDIEGGIKRESEEPEEEEDGLGYIDKLIKQKAAAKPRAKGKAKSSPKSTLKKKKVASCVPELQDWEILGILALTCVCNETAPDFIVG